MCQIKLTVNTKCAYSKNISYTANNYLQFGYLCAGFNINTFSCAYIC